MKLYKVLNNTIKQGFINLSTGDIKNNYIFDKVHCCTFGDLYNWIVALSSSVGKFALDLYEEDLYIAKLTIDPEAQDIEIYKNARILDRVTKEIISVEGLKEFDSLTDT